MGYALEFQHKQKKMETFSSGVSFNFMSYLTASKQNFLSGQNPIQRFSLSCFQLNLNMIWVMERRPCLSSTVQTLWIICVSFLSVSLFSTSIRARCTQCGHGRHRPPLVSVWGMLSLEIFYQSFMPLPPHASLLKFIAVLISCHGNGLSFMTVQISAFLWRNSSTFLSLSR